MVKNLKDEILFGSDGLQFLQSTVGANLSLNVSVCLLVDKNSRKHCLPFLFQHCPKLSEASIIDIEEGENHKNLSTCQKVWQELTKLKFTRDSLIINVGGGVVCDLGGFVAATYKRGVDFIHIPTTLLAQVDASVGSKTGINFQGIKNIIGCFSDPRAVCIFPELLHTLPRKEIMCGYAEVLKHALIADKQLWGQLKTLDPSTVQNWETLIRKSIAIKQAVVSKDKRENSMRKILNFGHTVGHALESYAITTLTPVTHGEAVAAGMICESYLSSSIGNLTKQESNEITEVITGLYQPIIFEKPYEQILDFMANDKKNKPNRLGFSLLETTGHAVPDRFVASQEIKDSLDYYLRQTGRMP